MKRALYCETCSACALMCVLSMAVFARPQSLGEVARRAQQRCELAAKKPKKVYTNDDFPSVAPAAVPVPSSPLPAANSKEQPAAPAKVDEAELERQWRKRFAEARASLHKAEQDAWQTRITTVFVGGEALWAGSVNRRLPCRRGCESLWKRMNCVWHERP